MNTTLRENIDWVGYVDWNVRDFHGYDTDRGSDLQRLPRARREDRPDRHGEGPVCRTAAGAGRRAGGSVAGRLRGLQPCRARPRRRAARGDGSPAQRHARVRRQVPARRSAEHFDTSGWKIRIVADGETLSLGRRTLRFIETPMVHWPESMFTYVARGEAAVLDGRLRAALRLVARFDDEAPLATVLDEAKTYYANIVMPYGKAGRPVLRTGGDAADRHDRPEPRRDLAEPRAGDPRGLRRLVGLPAGGQGRW